MNEFQCYDFVSTFYGELYAFASFATFFGDLVTGNVALMVAYGPPTSSRAVAVGGLPYKRHLRSNQ